MSTETGVWEPRKPFEIKLEVLKDIANRMAELVANPSDNSTPSDVAKSLTAEEIRDYAILMKQDPATWTVADSLKDEEITILIRFFTLAEMQISGWDGGKDSPVIPLVKILKNRDAFPPELRKWIKANTDNRFLPYGSAL